MAAERPVASPVMRVCVISRGDAGRDPRLAPLTRSLVRAGHDVSVVSAGKTVPDLAASVDFVAVPSRVPVGNTTAKRTSRKLQPAWLRSRTLHRRLVAAARATGADLVYPLAARDVGLAAEVAGTTGAVFRAPRWPDPGPRDIARLAPYAARWSSAPAGPGLGYHTDLRPREVAAPEPGRFADARVVLALRDSPTTPGRYVKAALERAGVTVEVHDGILDFDAIDESVAFVLVVESPYPALEVTGDPGGVPVLYWVHHGEHHLDANLRLVERYHVDSVLLAHSWHLAHRFGVPVQRFPFAVAPEVSGPGAPFDARPYDVAFVGAGLDAEGGTYARRRRMVDDLRSRVGDRGRFEYGLKPEEMGALYRDTRVVINEVGNQHHPITMRVFETVGNGALLLTDDEPGTDLLLRRGEHYVVLEDAVGAQIEGIVQNSEGAPIAAAAHRWAEQNHTYDHRVDELFAIAAVTDPRTGVATTVEKGELAKIIDRDVEVQVVVVHGNTRLASELPTREVRDAKAYADRLRPGTVDAVVIDGEPPDDVDGAVAAARSFVYATGGAVDVVESAVLRAHPDADLRRSGSVLRADLGTGGYRRRPPDHPLA